VGSSLSRKAFVYAALGDGSECWWGLSDESSHLISLTHTHTQKHTYLLTMKCLVNVTNLNVNNICFSYFLISSFFWLSFYVALTLKWALPAAQPTCQWPTGLRGYQFGSV
jgi:hypothetical protein